MQSVTTTCLLLLAVLGATSIRTQGHSGTYDAEQLMAILPLSDSLTTEHNRRKADWETLLDHHYENWSRALRRFTSCHNATPHTDSTKEAMQEEYRRLEAKIDSVAGEARADILNPTPVERA